MKLITLIRTEDDEPFYEAYTYKFKNDKPKAQEKDDNDNKEDYGESDEEFSF